MRFLGGGGPWAIHPVSALAEMGCSTDCGVAEPCPILATAGLSSILTLSISPSPLCPALTCQTLLLLFLPYNSYLAASLGTALTSRYVDAARRIDVLHQPCRTHSNTGPLPALSQHMLHRPLIKPPAASTALIPSHHPPPGAAIQAGHGLGPPAGTLSCAAHAVDPRMVDPPSPGARSAGVCQESAA